MAKIVGPDFIALQVRDLEASRRFYTDALGLEPAPQSPPGAVVFQTAPIPFAIREPAVDLARPRSMKPSPPPRRDAWWSDWRSTTHPNTGVGWTWRKSS